MTLYRMAATAALAATLALLPASPPAAATSVVATPPHRADRACALTAEVFAGLVANASPRPGALMGLSVTTDTLGTVAWEENEARATELGSHAGKPDRVPLRLLSLHRLDAGREETAATYVAMVERDRWELERYTGSDGLLMPVYEPDPHYETRSSSWLVTFRGNRIWTLREAGELWPLGFDPGRMDCRGAIDPDGPIPAIAIDKD